MPVTAVPLQPLKKGSVAKLWIALVLLAALSSGKVMLGLATVVVFSLGFAATLVAVGLIAAKVGEKILDWLSSIWVVRVQIATTLLILGMGVVLTVKAANQLASLPG